MADSTIEVNWFQPSLLRRPFGTSLVYAAVVFSWGRFLWKSILLPAVFAVPLLILLLALSFPRVGLLRHELRRRADSSKAS